MKYLVILLVVVVYSCTNNNTKYKYQKEFDKYTSNIGCKTLSDSIIFLQLDGCSCAEETIKLILNKLNKEKKKIDLIIGGKSQNTDINSLLFKLKNKYTVYCDSKSIYRRYRLNIFKPTLIILQNEKIKETETIYSNAKF